MNLEWNFIVILETIRKIVQFNIEDINYLKMTWYRVSYRTEIKEEEEEEEGYLITDYNSK